MITANSWQQQERIELMSKADFELAWALADFPERLSFQDAMNGHQVKDLLARMLILGIAVSAICQRCALTERERKRLLMYAKDVYSQLFPRIGEMFIYETKSAPVRRIRLSSYQ